jgi:oligosaccharide reducing-end xylanase
MPAKSLLIFGVTAITLIVAPAVPAAPAVTTAQAARRDDGSGAYRTRRYRNLLAERLGISPQETHQKIERTFQQLFHGDGQE